MINLPLLPQCSKEIEESITSLLSQMTLEEKCSILHGSTMFDSPGIERLNIPPFNMSDGPHGVYSAPIPTTVFPSSIALAASWDTEYMETVGAAMGKEFKAAGKNMALSPAVDLGRDPRNGRASETIGEDPFLGGKIGAALSRGLQSNNIIATVKHFIAQNHDGDRTKANPTMDKRTMRELYGLVFKIVIEEGEVYSVMSAYNLVNGLHCSQYDEILTQMLRKEWGFKYFVVSDWYGTYDEPEKLINAGLDLEMPHHHHFKGMQEAVEKGKVSMETLDLAVRRTMRARFQSGLMDPKCPKANTADIDSAENRKINLEAAKKSIVLLKNSENILPLKKTGTIALIGPNADSLPITSFGSSEILNPAYKISTRQGISNIAPLIQVKYERGCDINSPDTSGYDAAKIAAKNADTVVFVGGLDSSQEGESYQVRKNLDRTGGSVMIPGQQAALILELAATNPNLIVILQSGGIVSVGHTLEKIKGLVYAWYCGGAGGDAIAQVLFGDYNPAGKLPIVMPVDDSQLPEWKNLDFTNDHIAGFGYRRFDKTGEIPLFNFGHGLSYATFEYSNIKVSSEFVDGDKGVQVCVDVRNNGGRDGEEVVQLYLSAKVSVAMPLKQLKGFQRVKLSVGESKKVGFVLGPKEMCYWSEQISHYFVEKGKYVARVGGSSDNLPLEIGFEVKKEFAIPNAEEI